MDSSGSNWLPNLDGVNSWLMTFLSLFYSAPIGSIFLLGKASLNFPKKRSLSIYLLVLVQSLFDDGLQIPAHMAGGMRSPVIKSSSSLESETKSSLS